MKKRNRIACLLMALLFLSANFFVLGSRVDAANNIQVILDGRTLYFDVPPQIISDRTMVPFRAIGEAMEATVDWNDSQRKVTMYLNDSYIILYIDSPVMTYGKFSTDTNGYFTASTAYTYALDAPATIVNSRTLVPARAISEGLGATVTWTAATSTVYITSPIKPTPIPTPMPTPSPSPTPTPTPTPTTDAFESTSYFDEISARRAQSMYDNDDKFVMVYYSSHDQDSIDYVPIIKDAARSEGYKVYGVDVDSTNYENLSSHLTFIWDYVRKSNVAYPTMFFVNGKNDIDYLKPTSRKDLISEYIYEFWRRTQATATPTPTGATAPPTSAPTITAYTRRASQYNLTNMMNNGTRFIYVYCYYSGDTIPEGSSIARIMQASVDAKTYIYVENGYYLDGGIPWGKQFRDQLSDPTIIYVNGQDSKAHDDVSIETSVSDTWTLQNKFIEFDPD